MTEAQSDDTYALFTMTQSPAPHVLSDADYSFYDRIHCAHVIEHELASALSYVPHENFVLDAKERDRLLWLMILRGKTTRCDTCKVNRMEHDVAHLNAQLMLLMMMLRPVSSPPAVEDKKKNSCCVLS